MVADMPLPISAAFRAKSDLRGRASPFAADFCASVRRERRWEPTLLVFWRRCACARTDLNSAVRSCTDVETAIVADVCCVLLIKGKKGDDATSAK